MKSVRKLLGRFKVPEESARIFSSSASVSTLNEILTISVSPSSDENSTLPGNQNERVQPPPPAMSTLMPGRNREESLHEVTPVHGISNSPGSNPLLSITTAMSGVSFKRTNGNIVKDTAIKTWDGNVRKVFVQSLPTPITTGSTDNDEDNENCVNIARKPTDLPANMPTSSTNDNDLETGDKEVNSNTLNGESHRSQQILERKDILEELGVDVSNFDTSAEPCFALFYRFLFYIGVVPFKFFAAADGGLQLHWFHKVACTCLLLLALLHSLYFVKHTLILEEYGSQKLKFFITLFYASVSVSLPLAHAILMFVYKKEIASMFDTLRALGALCSNVSVTTLNFRKFAILITIFVTVVGKSLHPVLVSASYVGFDIKEIIRDKAEDFSLLAYVWKREENTTEILEQYVSNAAMDMNAMGFIMLAISVAGGIYEALIKDVPLWLAVTMFGSTSCLSTILESPILAEKYRPQIWSTYRLLRVYSMQIHLYFEVYLQLMHFEYLFFCVYVLFYTIIYDVYGWFSLALLFTLAKIAIFYIVSAAAAEVNDTLRVWIKGNHQMDDVMYQTKTVAVTATVILDDLSNDPIGIGKKLYFINKSSLWKMIGIVLSCFLFFVDHQ